MTDLIQAVYRTFSPAPLTPEQYALYVNLDEARGEANIVGRLATKIRLAEQPTCQVLAGHRGSGKSTELLRLKQDLQTALPRYFVVYCKADDDVDRNDVDFPEILIAIVRQIAAQLKQPPTTISLKPGYFKDRWQRLKKFFATEVEFETLELDIGLATLGGTIKASPDARMEVRKLLEPDTANWLHAANEVIGQAVIALAKKDYAGLVVLVDDLDKMTVRPHETAARMTDEHLFLNRAPQLTAFACHLVYTMPLSLAFSHHQQTIKQTYGGHLPLVPMTKLTTRPPRPQVFLPGVEEFRRVIAARLKAAKAKQQDVFASSQVLDDVIQLSGGQPAELMTIVREVVIAHGLPINAASLQRAKFAGQRDYARWLREEHWPIIEQVRRSGRFNRTERNEQTFRELLESRAILQYVNDEDEWYALNPMVGGLKPPAEIGTMTAKRGVKQRRKAPRKNPKK